MKIDKNMISVIFNLKWKMNKYVIKIDNPGDNNEVTEFCIMAISTNQQKKNPLNYNFQLT